MKTTKRLWPFVLADNKLAAEYLEKQAAKGLVLEKFELWGFVASYKKEEPQIRSFCVDGFVGDKEEQGRYIRMAKDAGWQYVAEQPGHLFFISKENETPIPTQTDWREEYLQIRKSLWTTEMPVGILLGFLALFASIDPAGLLKMFIESPEVWAIYAFGTISFVKAVLFYVKSSLAFRRNVPMKNGSWKAAVFWGYLRAVTGIAAFGCMIAYGISNAADGIGVGNWGEKAGLYVVILGMILYITTGVRSKSTDDLGRIVRYQDEKSKKIGNLGAILMMVGLIAYMWSGM